MTDLCNNLRLLLSNKEKSIIFQSRFVVGMSHPSLASFGPITSPLFLSSASFFPGWMKGGKEGDWRGKNFCCSQSQSVFDCICPCTGSTAAYIGHSLTQSAQQQTKPSEPTNSFLHFIDHQHHYRPRLSFVDQKIA